MRRVVWDFVFVDREDRGNGELAVHSLGNIVQLVGERSPELVEVLYLVIFYARKERDKVIGDGREFMVGRLIINFLKQFTCLREGKLYLLGCSRDCRGGGGIFEN